MPSMVPPEGFIQCSSIRPSGRVCDQHPPSHARPSTVVGGGAWADADRLMAPARRVARRTGFSMRASLSRFQPAAASYQQVQARDSRDTPDLKVGPTKAVAIECGSDARCLTPDLK